MNDHLSLYAAAYTIDNGKPSQRSACAVGLFAPYLGKRGSVVRGLGAVTAPQADIRAAQLALEAVRPEFRDRPTTLHTRSQYVTRLLERAEGGAYRVDPKSNRRAAERLRELSETFRSLQLARGDSAEYEDALEAAKRAAGEQSNDDTGTLDTETPR